MKNIKIEGGMEIDDKILLIETFINNDFLLIKSKTFSALLMTHFSMAPRHSA
jgi:hypothetical protein